MSDTPTVERAGETGNLCLSNLDSFLDDIFYAPFRKDKE